jgi:hypothetical protein
VTLWGPEEKNSTGFAGLKRRKQDKNETRMDRIRVIKSHPVAKVVSSAGSHFGIYSLLEIFFLKGIFHPMMRIYDYDTILLFVYTFLKP